MRCNKWWRWTDLINQRTSEFIVLLQHNSPEVCVTASNKVACLALEEGVFIADLDDLLITLATLVCHTGQVGITLLTVFANNMAVIILIFPVSQKDDDYMYWKISKGEYLRKRSGLLLLSM
jgi:hypothetical protein